MIALDTTALYGGTEANGSFQQRSRERMTLAAYNEARNNRTQSVIWAAVAALHFLIVLFAASGMPDFVSELTSNQGYMAGLAIWLLADMVYLFFFPTIYNSYQSTMDRLEGKVLSRR